jgi:hypothetical protein
MSYSNTYELSNYHINAVNSSGNEQLISIMNSGNYYQQSGDKYKEAVYHNYVIQSLESNYSMKFNDNSSTTASNNNTAYYKR